MFRFATTRAVTYGVPLLCVIECKCNFATTLVDLNREWPRIKSPLKTYEAPLSLGESYSNINRPIQARKYQSESGFSELNGTDPGIQRIAIIRLRTGIRWGSQGSLMHVETVTNLNSIPLRLGSRNGKTSLFDSDTLAADSAKTIIELAYLL